MIASLSRYRTFLRFLLVGAALSGPYAVLAALATTHLPLPMALSSALIWVACIPIGFWLHRHFTFTSRTAHRHGLWLYAATQILGVGITSGTSFLLARGVFWQDVFVHLLASGLAAIASYLINRWIVFPDQSAE